MAMSLFCCDLKEKKGLAGQSILAGTWHTQAGEGWTIYPSLYLAYSGWRRLDS